MKTAIRNIVFALTIWVYIFGSSGFTVHHCCCKKHYHTTCAIINAWEHYVFSGCEKHNRDASEVSRQNEDGSSSQMTIVKKAKGHCTDFLYTMESQWYSNEDNLQAPAKYIVELLQYLPVDLHTITESQYFGADIEFFYNYDTSHYRYRQWCPAPDVLCTFII